MATERNVRLGWEARLDLEFAMLGTRTFLARRSSVGPLVVQRPFYPEGDVCHVYVVHPPGGVVGGDRLDLNVRALKGAHALITTPAATKFYRSDGRVARQSQEIFAESAVVEWLPQETIIFPEARAHIATRVRLNAQSRFMGWEMACYGRPASGLAFEAGHIAQDFELWVDGVPLLLDHLRLDGAEESMLAPFGLAGDPVLGTLLAYPADSALLESVRGVLADGVTGEAAPRSPSIAGRLGAVTAACSCVDGVLVCRAVASQADAVRRVFIEIWRRIRPVVAGRAAVAPRIWAT